MTVAFGAGLGAWFVLGSAGEWLTLAAALLGLSCGAAAALGAHGRFPFLRQALVVVPLMAVAGLCTVWTKSELVGVAPIGRPIVATLDGRVLDRSIQPAEDRLRLVLATREPGTGRAIRVRLNLPLAADDVRLAPGARIQVRARLVPPAPPMLPGGYDFAMTAWFAGLAATGSALGPVTIVAGPAQETWLSTAREALSRHVREQLPDAAGAIVTAFATGDQSAIPLADQAAMRDAGLSHLLSVSGLHVSAVIAVVYFVAIRTAALWPWLALRVRLPVLAAGAGALAAIGYTLFTGAAVPTIRSCLGALLVLIALALGRETLSLRMLAVAAFVVLLIWPEAIAGPSFQLSFAAVTAIIALHSSAPMRRFLTPGEYGIIARFLRAIAVLLLTGAAVELALLPIGLYHFHRAGLYGTVANVIAIPLTEVVVMPLMALALVLDAVSLGWPAWWLAGQAIDAMLAMAHWISAQPGAVTMMPAMGRTSYALFVAGGLWLGLWRGRARLAGLVPIILGVGALALLRPPDLLISGDGRQVGLIGASDPDGGGQRELMVLRASRGGYAGETLAELAGMSGPTRLITEWPAARCTPDFCALVVHQAGRDWRMLIARGRDFVPTGRLIAACAAADIVIADRRLPPGCRPRALKADRAMLARTGGLAIDLTRARVTTVAQEEGEHGWWHPDDTRPAGAGSPIRR